MCRASMRHGFLVVIASVLLTVVLLSFYVSYPPTATPSRRQAALYYRQGEPETRLYGGCPQSRDCSQSCADSQGRDGATGRPSPCLRNASGIGSAPLEAAGAVPPAMEDRGYVVAIRHYEQQTQGMRNHLQLHCLGHAYGLRVVEPFMSGSSLVVPFDQLLAREQGNQSLVSLGDIIDLEIWNEQVGEKFNYKPVVDWLTFLANAPRDVIAPCIIYRDPKRLPVPLPHSDYTRGCPPGNCPIGGEFQSFLDRHGFRVVHTPCFNFIQVADYPTVDEFVSELLGNYAQSRVTIMLREFRGFYGLYRLPVLSPCGILHFRMDITIRPSHKIERDVEKYLSSAIKGTNYFGVLIRIERIVLHLHYNITQCASEVADIFENLHTTYPGAKVFLGMDVGSFGSKGTVMKNLTHYGRPFVDALFKGKLTFEDWDASMRDYISIDSEGYVANFQRSVVSKSSCLVMVGGGGFQMLARHYYYFHHPTEGERCIRRACMKRQD